MSLITRTGKGSKLTIQEMDKNLNYLNNGNKLLCKKIVNLNPPLLPLANPVILTMDCIDDTIRFIIGETITNDLGGTATIFTEENSSHIGGLGRGCIGGSSLRRLTISNLSGIWDGIASITSTDSEIITTIRYQDTAYEDDVLLLDSTGSKFIITDVIITNKICLTPISEDSPSASIYDGSFGGGYLIANFALSDLSNSRYWVAASTISPSNTNSGDAGGGISIRGTAPNVTVGNTLYFTVDLPEGSTSTAEVSVYGYILE